VSPPRPQLKWLHAVSGGNPFIAIELAKALPGGEADFDSERPLEVPTSLRELAHRRLAALSGPERGAALVASVLARPTVAALEGVLGPGGREAVRGAVDAGVLDLDRERVRLTHPLLGSVLYAEATPEERRELHRRVARVPSDPEERARHLALAAEGRDPAVALALEEAAHTARFRGALEEAARLAERARELTPEGQTAELRRRTLAAAEYYFDAGSLARAHALLAKLAGEAAPGAERAEVLVRIAEVTFAEEGWEAAVGPLDDALAEAGDDLRSSANVERRLAWGYHMAGDVPAAEEHATKASALAETLGEPALLAQTVTNRLFLARLRGDAPRHDEIEAAIALERGAGRMPILERPSWQHAVMLLWADDLEGAQSIFERLHGESVERGDETSRPFLLHYLARIECRSGRLENAERLAEEAREMTIQTGQDTEHAFALATCALIDAHLGHVGAARASIAEGLAIASRTKLRPAEFELLAALGFLELSLGDAEATVRVLAPLADAVAAAGFGEPSVYRFHPNAIEALVATGRLDEAETMLVSLERHGESLEGPWVIATAGRCRGLLLAASRDLDGAGRTLEAALQAHERLTDPLERARTLLALGAVRRRQRKKGAARDALEEACLFFDGLPAPLWAERARGELARLGGRPASRWDLTETERLIADLVAEGRTNREVADALFISVKTVEWNLSKVYGKLGIRSRTELASKAGAGTDKPGDSPGS
jgi:DNA-binding CsgD family transcriptional regulator